MSSITPARDPVPEPLLALIDLFEAHSEALRFPEVDHETLESLAGRVRDAAAEVERCEQALATARNALDQHREALRARAGRGLAYARVYAQDQAPLLEQLDAIQLEPVKAPRRRAKRPPRTRRTKPAVADETVKELPFAPEAEPARADVA